MRLEREPAPTAVPRRSRTADINPGSSATHCSTPDAVPFASSTPSLVVETAMMLRGCRTGTAAAIRPGSIAAVFVQWVFAQTRLAVAARSTGAVRGGHKVSLRDVQPGDLVFFQT
jgi:cell wall-associated NlpC family hydrolase